MKKWGRELYRRRFFIIIGATLVAIFYLLFWVISSAVQPTTYLDRKYFTIEKTTMSQLGELTISNESYGVNKNLTEYQDIIKSMLLRPPLVTSSSEEPIANQIIETYQLEKEGVIVKIGEVDHSLSPNENKSLRQVIQKVLGLNIINEYNQEDQGLVKIVEDTLVFNQFSGVSKIECNTINAELSRSLKEEIYQELQSSYLAKRDEKNQTELKMKTLLLDSLIAKRNLAEVEFNKFSETVQQERDSKSLGIIRNATPVSPDEFVSKDLIAQFELAQSEYLALEKRSRLLEEGIHIQKFTTENEIIEFKEISDLENPIKIKPLSISGAIKHGLFKQLILYFVLSGFFIGVYILSSMAFRNVTIEE